ncbi:hypothetical protein V6N13_125409 [Hibiscus sabdariffa]|uniref:HMG box domain-containing protein n=1 Tax=Hibiscus sabdariffa TaxID=183260 RepID=A0ABR2U5K5_9ROSI
MATNSEATTPMSSMPLQLSGFLSGNTIQVEGDTGNLQFSLKFDIHHNKCLPSNDTHFPFPSLSSPENDMFCQNSSSSPYQTPQSTRQTENDILDLETLTLAKENHGVEEIEEPESETTKRGTVLTRLKTGAISQVKYFFPRISREKCRDSRSCRMMRRKGKKRERERERGDELLDKLLQRRCCPVKPCNSYVFFVMARWGSVKSSSSSFVEASKRLSQMWCKLPRKHKKIYEDIAVKDSARYKRQCMLLNCKDHDLSADQSSSVDELHQALNESRQIA